MNIIPISSMPVQTSSVPGAAKAGQTDSGSAFKDIFSDALQNINETNAAKEQDTKALVAGDVDDLAAIAMNSQEAEIALQLLIQMRNRLVDGYQEIMRLNV